MYKKFLSTALLVCCCALVTFAVIADINGKWAGALLMDGNSIPLTYTFKVDGDKLTGVAESPYGPANIDNGKIKDNTFSFSTTVSGMDIPQTGKFYGDSVALDVEVNGAKLHTVLLRSK